ncbi:hypothetical protein AB0B66_25525 [Catellatospora sp. NPDC049111]|uniref:hypothetical protein n=1 Tax=Catellatospora sp. NPDC049111 TaxID=3155271 RepID=UPI003408030A
MPTPTEPAPTGGTSVVPAPTEPAASTGGTGALTPTAPASTGGTTAVPAPTGVRRTAGAVLSGMLGHAAVVGVVLAAARVAVAEADGDLEAGGRFAVFYSSVCLLLSGEAVLLALVAWGAGYGGAGWRRGLWAGWAAGLALLVLWIASWW